MISFRRRKSISSMSIYEETADNASMSSIPTRKMDRPTLCLPKNLEDVVKSQHGNLPKNLPREDASQEEVRYYLYSILTCKDNNTAKAYPQWVLETCMSWEGNGKKLRNMTDEELQILCPLRAGYADINSSRKHRLDELPLPAARQSIGAAIARAVTAGRTSESRRSGGTQEWNNPALNRSSRRFGSAEDFSRQTSELQLSIPPHDRPQTSLTNLPRPGSLRSFRLDSTGTVPFSPSLPNVHESHNDANYFPRQNFVPPCRPTPLPRHMNPTRYAQSTDSSSVESPGSSNGLLSSITSQDSNSISQTSLAAPEGSPDGFSNTQIHRHASPSTSIKQSAPRYEHKETLAELEAGPVNLDARHTSPVSLNTPRRYKSTPSIHSVSVRKSPRIPVNESRQLEEFPRPSRLRTAIQSDDSEQPHSPYYNCGNPSTNVFHCSTSNGPNQNIVPAWEPESLHNATHHTDYVNRVQSQHNDESYDQPLNLTRSQLRLYGQLHSRVPILDNSASVPADLAQDLFIHPTCVRRASRPDLQSWGDSIRTQQQDGNLRLSHWNGSGNSPVGPASRKSIQQPDITGQNDNLSWKHSRPRLSCFQSTRNIAPPRSAPVGPVAPMRSGPQIRMCSISEMGEVGVSNGSTSTARTANNHRIDSLALDQADFHVWKAKLPIDKSIMTHVDGHELVKSQSDYIAQRSRDKTSRDAWNSDLRGPKGAAGPSVRYMDSFSRQPRQTFYEAIEQREILEGKPQRGVDRGLAQDWRRYH